MFKNITRKSLRGIQFISSQIANYQESKVKLPDAHDLFKAKFMAEHIQDGSNVLDVGCSNGRRLMEISLFVKEMKATGVELSQRTPPKPIHPNMVIPKILEFNGKIIPFSDKEFDTTTICYVLHHLNKQHAQELLEEIIRVTKNQIIILEDSRPNFNTAYKIRNWAHATEANLGYEDISQNFTRNMNHNMFKTHQDWVNYLNNLPNVVNTTYTPLNNISNYKHHTMFVVHLANKGDSK